MTTVRELAERRAVRVVGGLLVSLAFVLVTLSRVDLAGVVAALGRAAPAGLAIGLLFACLEICARAWRWQYLLRPIKAVPYLRSLAYLCIGYFANTLLPVRLGDVARAYLAGTAFGVPRLATLGTVLLERLVDGLAILAVALLLGLAVSGGAPLVATALWVCAAAALGLGALATAAFALRGPALARSRPVALARDGFVRLVAGADAVRTPAGLLTVVGWTLGAFLLAVVALAAVARAVGVYLDPLQAAFVMAGVALSTAIPAAPGSLGTYEFVGMTLLVALGFDPEASLAAIVLLHLAGTIPASLAGLVMTWHYHLRVATIAEEASPA